MTDVRTNYEYLTHNGNKLVVDAAIRDGEGYRISTAYAKKLCERIVYVTESSTISINHGLGDIPSVVTVFEQTGENTFEQVGVPYEATPNQIILKFGMIPPYGTTLKIKAVI